MRPAALSVVAPFLAWTAFSCALVGKPEPALREEPARIAPEDWARIDARGIFTFRVPPDMRRQKVPTVGSYCEQYGSGRLQLLVLHGPDVGPLAKRFPGKIGGLSSVRKVPRKRGEPQNGEAETMGGFLTIREIGGERAEFFTYRSPSPFESIAAIRIPSLTRSHGTQGGEALSMWILCKGPEDLEAATTILDSIAFPRDEADNALQKPEDEKPLERSSTESAR
jgi:hypothetical protein